MMDLVGRMNRIGRTPGEVMTKGYIPAAQLYDNPEQNLTLIRSVEKRESLYNIGSGGVGKEKREEARKLWDAISSEINLPADECKSRWGHLRSDFRGKVKAYHATGRVHHKEWIYYSALEFLIPYIKTHKHSATPEIPLATQAIPKKQFGRPLSHIDMGNLPPYYAAPVNPPYPPAAHQPVMAPSPAKQARYSNDSSDKSAVGIPKYYSSGSMSQDNSPAERNNNHYMPSDRVENASEIDSDSMCVISSEESDTAPDVPTTVPQEPQARTLIRNKRKKGRPLKVVLGGSSRHSRLISEREHNLSVQGQPSPPTLTKAPSAVTKTASAAVVSTHSTGHKSVLISAHHLPHQADTNSPRNPNIFIAESSAPWAGAHPHPANHIPVPTQAPPTQEEPTLLVTITDTTNIQRMFCQKITYQEAANLNLRDFFVQRWEQVNGVGVTVSPHPSEHYTVVSSNGYMPPPAHMFGRAFQESRNSTAGRHSAAVHHPATRSATRGYAGEHIDH